MVVGQQTLCHRHRQVGDAGGLDQRANCRVRLRISRTFAEQYEGPLRAFEKIDGAKDRVRRRNLARNGVDHTDQRLSAMDRVQRLSQQLRR